MHQPEDETMVLSDAGKETPKLVQLFTIGVNPEFGELLPDLHKLRLPKVLWASSEDEVMLLVCLKMFKECWEDNLSGHKKVIYERNLVSVPSPEHPGFSYRKFNPEYKGPLVEPCPYAATPWPKNEDGAPDFLEDLEAHSPCRIAHACGFKTVEDIDFSKIAMLYQQGTHKREIEYTSCSVAPLIIKALPNIDTLPVASILIQQLVVSHPPTLTL